jgi:microcystin-dependent protein
MSDYFLSEIRIFAGNYVPTDWALCNGSVLSISSNEALFALVGALYGGDGLTTFALPNMNGRIPINFGAGAGLTNRGIASSFGSENVILTMSQLPNHLHPIVASTNSASVTSPSGCLTGVPSMPIYDDSAGGYSVPALAPGSILPEGGGQPHNNVMPSLVLTFMICVQNGVYPLHN